MPDPQLGSAFESLKQVVAVPAAVTAGIIWLADNIPKLAEFIGLAESKTKVKLDLEIAKLRYELYVYRRQHSLESLPTSLSETIPPLEQPPTPYRRSVRVFFGALGAVAAWSTVLVGLPKHMRVFLSNPAEVGAWILWVVAIAAVISGGLVAGSVHAKYRRKLTAMTIGAVIVAVTAALLALLGHQLAQSLGTLPK